MNAGQFKYFFNTTASLKLINFKSICRKLNNTKKGKKIKYKSHYLQKFLTDLIFLVIKN